MKSLLTVLCATLGMVIGYFIVLSLFGQQPWYYWLLCGVMMAAVSWKLGWLE
jgi:hypothetical protein